MTATWQRLQAAGPAIVLRAFFGVTFTFAGLQKLANPNFFKASAPTSFQSQLHGALSVSPIDPLLRLTLHAAVPIAVIIAVAEVLIGLGTLVGLLARAAATGGALLSLSFFLTISWGTSPYYYGSDIVFFFGWTVLILGGAGSWSLDALLRQRATHPTTQPSATGDPISRRRLLQRGVVSAVGVAAAGVVIGADAAIGHVRHTDGAVEATTTTTTTAGSSGGGDSATSTTDARTKIVAADAVAVGGAHTFTDPQSGPAFVVHDKDRGFVAFSAICTHAGCTVNFDSAGERFVCPCHGSIYNAATGAVMNGPATAPLPSIAITDEGGSIYLG